MMTPEGYLQHYATRNDQAAFAEIVSHFTPLVYGLAMRRSGRAELAVEIAQDVFLALARKAPALSAKATPLGPWLHRTTLLETMNHLRKEATHRRRTAAVRAETDALPASAVAVPEAAWLAALPHLDEAMNDLGETDRTALLMRFYSGRTFPEIAGAMGRTEDGARKLCTRAVEKLSALLRLRGVALSAGALGTAMTADWASAAATVPSGLTASLTSHVLSQVTAPTAAATGAGGLISALTTMKSSTSVLTAAVLLLIVAPAAWQWHALRETHAVTLAREAELSALVSAKKPSAPAPLRTGGVSGPKSFLATATTSEPLTPEVIRTLLERLLTLRRGNANGDIDVATQMETQLLHNQIKSWPAASVRLALDQLIAHPSRARARLELLAALIESPYAEKDPAGATELSFRLLKDEGSFENGARLSLSEWISRDPQAARTWLASQEAAGALESTGVEERSRRIVAESLLLGQALTDPSAAREAFAKADPATAEAALLVLASQRPPGELPNDLRTLATALPDPARGGRAIGRWTFAGSHPVNDVKLSGEQLNEKLPADLPPAVRTAALIEGAKFGQDLGHSLAVLGHATQPAQRIDALAELTRQMVASGSPIPAENWFTGNSPLKPFRDEITAATALALGRTASGQPGPDPAAAAELLERIQDPARRAAVASQLASPTAR
jgi:RNA polymerase sigma factor (sigma-70 family)